jgi:hypothetical protein
MTLSSDLAVILLLGADWTTCRPGIFPISRGSACAKAASVRRPLGSTNRCEPVASNLQIVLRRAGHPVLVSRFTCSAVDALAGMKLR